MADLTAPPADLAAEENVLGAMLLSPAAVDAVFDAKLSQQDFYRGSHGLLYQAIGEMYAGGEPVDAITVADHLDKTGKLAEAGGTERIHEIAGLVAATSNVAHYAQIVRDMAQLRALIRVGGEITRLGWERPGETGELLTKAEALIFELTLERRSGDAVFIQEEVRASYRRVQERAEGGGADIIGIPTGFRTIDKITAGLHPGNLIVLAARPSMGKTALALGVTANIAVRAELARPVAIFTLEMNLSEVTSRLLSSEAVIDSYRLRTGRLDSDEWERLTATSGRLDRAPIIVDDSGASTATEIRSKARRLKLRHPDLALVVVDYLQLMTSGERVDSRVQDVSATSRAMKVLANELQIPVLALSQLSRAVEQRHDKRPILSDLRESGAIEQDADVVMFIYRDEYYNPDDTDQTGIAEVNFAKHRNGATGTVKLSFLPRFTKFSDIPHT